MKNEKKLEKVESELTTWIKQCEKDLNYELVSVGATIVIVEGIRNLETQKKYLASGKSTTLKSKHLPNKNELSQAIDIAVEINGIIDWNNLTWWKKIGAHFKAYFKDRKDILARWGGDWTTFKDYPHFEINFTGVVISPIKPSNVEKGDNGEIVKTIQKLLITKGYKIIADGDFGDNTDKAVKAFQTSKGITCDGIVGWKTLELLKSK